MKNENFNFFGKKENITDADYEDFAAYAELMQCRELKAIEAACKPQYNKQINAD